KSPMPGVVRKLAVAEGANVKAGQSVVVLEAMKM
ncbi:MAG: acetyl-CoA carboxylase biotin carboxyl carrier protein subunit, partial [Clostridia bacterium]|nr:acetyl-CoA carboxylase biotin carboxyl carrier protein subunit [Clostridia bacterium]